MSNEFRTSELAVEAAAAIRAASSWEKHGVVSYNIPESIKVLSKARKLMGEA